MPYKNPFSMVDLKPKRQGSMSHSLAIAIFFTYPITKKWIYLPGYISLLMYYILCCDAQYIFNQQILSKL